MKKDYTARAVFYGLDRANMKQAKSTASWLRKLATFIEQRTKKDGKENGFGKMFVARLMK